MAQYTIELRNLVNSGYHLALDKYPIFSEEYRGALNQKIIEHFWFREIGQETADRFNFMLRRKMNEIMPYYNELYKSTLMEFDPLASDFFTEGTKTGRVRDYTQDAKNRGKSGETIGEVFTSNEDMVNHYGMNATMDEQVDSTYSKQGDETIGVVGDKTTNVTGKKDIAKIGKRTEDLTQNETGTELLTNDLKEEQKETTKSNQVTTNDLTTNTVADGRTTGEAKKSGTNDTTFSDIPQAGVETTVVTAPDGTVTRTTKGYATTTTDVQYSETNNSKGTSHDESTTTNTGTVTVDSTGERSLTKDNTGTVNTDKTRDVTNDNTIDTTETEAQTWSEDTKEHWTEDTSKAWHESGTSKDVTGVKEKEDRDTTQNNKIDSEKNTANNRKFDNAHKETSNTKEDTTNVVTGKGRKGFSPADLIRKYRESLINVDMLVIDELEILFMGVY